MKVLTIIGARPQFIKSSILSRKINAVNGMEEIVVHTGQHFDFNMSEVFFQELDIKRPKYNLGVNGLSHGAMTGQMLEKIENILQIEHPDIVVVYGDTNSTIAGALSASKMNIKVAHIEAGLRSFNMKMPEEINRILTDRLSDYLFCPTDAAISNLRNEGFFNFKNSKVIHSGDIMEDVALYYRPFAIKPIIDLNTNKFVLVTLHRAETTDKIENIIQIINALNEIGNETTVVLPLHPRTKSIINKYSIKTDNIKIIEPVGYLNMLWLIDNSSIILTDSGGLQKEAFFFSKYCITLREETEWVELVENNYNIIAGYNKNKILNAYFSLSKKKFIKSHEFYGSGKASDIILASLLSK